MYYSQEQIEEVRKSLKEFITYFGYTKNPESEPIEEEKAAESKTNFFESVNK